MPLSLRPANPGEAASQIDTPALILDLDAFERNLARLMAEVKHSGLRVRPHAKSHKCPEIARRQMALGAVGICCQKVSEAEIFARAGITDILVTNEVVGAKKLARLVSLASQTHLGVLVDAESALRELGASATAKAVSIDVYIEVDVGAARCGVAPGLPAVALAKAMQAYPGLHFKGLHCYHGLAQHLRSPKERTEAIAQAARAASNTRQALSDAGFPVETITGAGTGSFRLERDSGVFTELQPGSYIFMDRDYAINQLAPGEVPFEHALFIETAVMSLAGEHRAVVDAGLKASSIDSGLPMVWQRDGLQYQKASDEHGVLEVREDIVLALGEHLRLVPGHCDPTVNLYDWLVCMRRDTVEALWPIEARGALL
ncbi:MAG: DSD1 family PLP-dependent enzyme [Burkholderiaceae bacterium]|jgi:D-serine deaminase-like pyridoxal phosphate-dependent protein